MRLLSRCHKWASLSHQKAQRRSFWFGGKSRHGPFCVRTNQPEGRAAELQDGHVAFEWSDEALLCTRMMFDVVDAASKR